MSQRSKYTEIFKLLLENPSGFNIEIPRDSVNRLRVGLARKKTKYNAESVEFNEFTDEPMHVINESIVVTELEEEAPSTPANVVVRVELASLSTFEFTLL